MPSKQVTGVPGISSPIGVKDPIAARVLSDLKQAAEHVVGHGARQTDIILVNPETITLPQLAAIVKRILEERLTG